MNIKEAKQEIKNSVTAYLMKEEGNYVIPSIRQRPILLMGPPGIGKTQIMEQIARECGVALVSYTITHHTRQSAVGLPFIKEESFDGMDCSVTEYTMSEIIASVYHKMQETGLTEGILFIDEINCVSETLAPTMLQFLQCKMFGNQRVPAGWIIIAAGNPPEYNKSVREFDVVTLDRVRRMDIAADYKVWREYAREANINNAILSYLDIYPKNFYRIESDVDGMQFVTARGWEDFSHLLTVYQQLHLEITEEIVYEFLRHREVAEEVAAYLELYSKYQDDYGIRNILEGNVTTEIYRRVAEAAFDERITVVNLLLDGLMQEFREVQNTKWMTDTWYSVLKEYRAGITQTEDGVSCYNEILERFGNGWKAKQKVGLLTEKEERRYQFLQDKMKEFVPKAGLEPKENFEAAKAGFEQMQERLKREREAAANELEAAFDFMEDAFGSGEEMIVFVTELTISSDSALFLAGETCDRYMKYSEELLIGTRRRELLSELDS